MAPPKGTVNNPNGRPPKSRALTTLLEKTGNKTVLLKDGRRVSGKRLLARSLWEGLTTGIITFPDGSKFELDPGDWMALSQFVYKHIDGPPPADFHLSGADGGAIILKWSDNEETETS